VLDVLVAEVKLNCSLFLLLALMPAEIMLIAVCCSIPFSEPPGLCSISFGTSHMRHPGFVFLGESANLSAWLFTEAAFFFADGFLRPSGSR
jgi:hypothetical protein